MQGLSPHLSAFDHEVWCRAQHDAEGQTYAGESHAVHLRAVEAVLMEHGFTSMVFRRSAWCHDIVEDCPKLHAEPLVRVEIVRDRYGDEVAEITWACSGFGKNRAARSADIAAKCKGKPKAIIVKVADRIANLEQSLKDALNGNPGMGKMYLKERGKFHEDIAQYAPPALRTRLDATYRQLEEAVS